MLRASFTALFTIVFVYSSFSQTQNGAKNGSSFTSGLGFGSDSYSESIDISGVPYINDEYEIVHDIRMGTARAILTTLVMVFRLQFETGLLNSRFRIGSEYILLQIGRGEASSLLEYEGNKVRGPDKMIHSVQIVGDYLVGDIANGAELHVSRGIGVLFFVRALQLSLPQHGPPEEEARRACPPSQKMFPPPHSVLRRTGRRASARRLNEGR